MTHGFIKAKVIAEIEVSPRGLGPTKLFSFLMEILNDETKTRRFMLLEGYTSQEVEKALDNIKTYQKRKANDQARAF